ncbi:zinc metalloprotease (family M50) [Skeletonema marinoi]|uniref:Zinc metalloprotease (Family M50) n=2 Tax=Skeletonema marinoi TaxID=267567 RepID=A0AAD9DG03_9STRA|nr:zinc metalloprotease (family M50) [Skeletonema marinoi]
MSTEEFGSTEQEQKKFTELKARVEELVRKSVGDAEAEQMLAGLSSFSSNNSVMPVQSSPSLEVSVALTEEEMKSAISFVGSLPIPVKDTLAKAAGYPNYDSIINLEERIYRKTSPSILQAFAKNIPGGADIVVKDSNEEYEIEGLSKAIQRQINDRMENSTRAMELFPHEAILPRDIDANVIFQLLDRTTFMAVEKPMQVEGGYIIRGKNKRKTATQLLEVIDEKLAKESPQWQESFQLSFVEIYADSSEQLFEDALLITPNKFAPMAPKLFAGVITAISLFSSFVYCIDTFSENEAVMQKLKEASEQATSGIVGAYDLTWFNELLVPMLVTLGLAQGLHEAGHLVMSWSKGIKMTPPTILPSQALPYLSFQNRLKTSPKDYTDLYDFAFAGPVTGLTVSFIALLFGLQLTTEVDQSVAQLLPSLPVGFITQSTLGGTIVDLLLGGGDGILINQDPSTQIPLHPIAIGGFLGMIIHAFDLVPIGSTDGGRMSQAVLGRVWHLTFSSLVFTVLFLTSLFSDGFNLLLGFLFIYSFTQRDMEIPCKNEIDRVELPRAVAAFVSWVLVALILCPLS